MDADVLILVLRVAVIAALYGFLAVLLAAIRRDLGRSLTAGPAQAPRDALVVFSEGEDQFQRAARNLANHKMLPVAGLNVYDVLNYDELVISEATARAIEKRLAGDER